ncbi:hypothetical protein TNCV_1998801, partial [Trichonephila clavipes]
RHPTAPARRWVFVTFFPSKHYSDVRSRLSARGTMTTTYYRTRSAACIRHFFFRRRSTLLSGRVLVHAER